tara:strand:+ start:18788 stop:19813 length:1026 start_codon:yes stop_codon:yes gene_type:complete
MVVLMYLWKKNMPGNRLEFPIHERDRYKARIRFETLVIDPIEVGSVINAHAANSTDASNFGAIAPEEFQNFLDLGGSFSQKLSFNTKEMLKRQVKRRSGETCHLYMPPSIQIQDGVMYENMEFGTFATGLNDILNSGSGGIAAVGKALKESSIFTDAAKIIRSEFESQDLARVGISKLVNKFGSAGGAVRSSLQTTPNPNMRAIFKSVNLREFSWSFKLIPNSKIEAEEIKDIINWFRKNLYPEGIVRGGVVVGYRFPPMFRIHLLYDTKEMDHTNEAFIFKDMHMKSFNATYNSGSSGFHAGGDYSEVDISMSFVESETFTRQDFDQTNARTMLDGMGVG